jgi:integrase
MACSAWPACPTPWCLVVQVLLGLQQRTAHGSKTAITDLAQICDQGRRTKAATVAELAGPGTSNRAVLARTLAGYVHRALLDPQAEKVKDVWDLAAFGHGGHLDFTAISQGWLREAAKLWAAEDLARRRGRAGGTVQDRLKSLARFSESLRGWRADHGETPATLGRSDIDTFLQRLAFLAGAGELSQYARARTCRAVRSILGRIRAMGLTRPGRVAAGLPDDVTLNRCDVPAIPDEPEPGRDLPPEIMRQLCEQLGQLGQRALTEFQVAAEIAIETGRRPDEICTLAWDCLHRDSDSNAVLVYDNRKSSRPGRRLPVSANAAQLIIEQKQRVRARYPGAPLDRLVLLPSPKSNPDGCRPISAAGLGNAHREWIDAMPPLLLADGTEFDKTRAVPYAYRHTYAQRHADAGVPIDVLRDLMDHTTFEVTRRYYRVGEGRRREAVDNVTALQFDRHGNRIWRDAQALLASEHARYTIGEVAVPYGTCTEPSNVQAGGGACPIRFRCAGCDHFRIRSACCTRLCCQCEGRMWWRSGSCSGSVAALRRKPRPAKRRLGGRILLTVSAGWGSGSGSRS